MVAREHSHHHAHRRQVFALGIAEGERLACVAIAERPKARALCDGRTIEVSRVASDRTEHAASKAVGAISRAAIALGYRRLVSYTLLGEAGTIYRAANWYPTALVDGREWDAPSRPREAAAQAGDKVRWEYGPGAQPRDGGIDALVREMVGKVEIPRKSDREPLFAWMKEPRA